MRAELRSGVLMAGSSTALSAHGLPALTASCEPRSDVRAGRLEDRHFAAQLWQVVRDPEHYPLYGDAEEFFALTYPTRGLRDLLARTFGRLSGANVPGAEHGLIRAETSFGGGKTHSLMAVYHLAKGARPSTCADFIDPAMLPGDCHVAAVVGDELDAVAGVQTDGITTHTLWGEIARQLGTYELMAANDERRTTPSTSTLERMVGDRPTIIIIDEVIQYLVHLSRSGDEDIRRLAGSVPVFLKALSELAAGRPNVVVILTLAGQADAYGRETQALGEALADTQSVLARSGDVIRPADDTEIAEILKRRLFARVDENAAEAVAAAYRSYYEQIGQRVHLGGGADRPADYADAVCRAYPFHPELIRVLDQRIGTIPGFQRARGALRLLADVVAALWDEPAQPQVINVADLDFTNTAVLDGLTARLGRQDFAQAARADFAAPDSHAARIDRERFAGGAPYATRACTTVFAHSLEQLATAGATLTDRLLGTLQVGDDPDIVDRALAEVERVAWHLHYDGTRYRFQTEPTPNRIIAEEARNLPASRVRQVVDEQIGRVFQTDGPITVVHDVTSPAHLTDEAKLRLAVIQRDKLAIRSRDADTAPDLVRHLLDTAGSSERPRTYRNAVCFLVADVDLIDTMVDRVRHEIAAEAIVSSPDRMASFTEEVRKKLRGLRDAALLDARVAISRCYRHLYMPWGDRGNGYLKHTEVPAQEQGNAQGVQTSHVRAVMETEGKVRQPGSAIPTDYLKARAWPSGEEVVATQVLADWFWRDHAAPLVLDPGVITSAIRAGVTNGTWVYYDTAGQRAYADSGPPPQVAISSDALLYTPEKAAADRLIGRDIRWDDVQQALGASVEMDAVALRAAVEDVVGREPTKGEITDILARAAEGETARIWVISDRLHNGRKALTPSQIKSSAFELMVILDPQEARSRGIEPATARKTLTLSGRGDAAPAFAGLADQAAERPDLKVTALLVTAYAEPGEGIRDIELLGKAITMVPRADVTAELELAIEFEGLSNGAEINVTGAAAGYRRIQQAVERLGNQGSEANGHLRLVFTFREPIAVGEGEYAQVVTAVTNLSPGTIAVEAIPA